MNALLERLAPYLDQQETEYPPSVCCAVAFAERRGVIGGAERDAVLAAIEADKAADDWGAFKCVHLRGTREDRIRQWRQWAEALIQSVDK